MWRPAAAAKPEDSEKIAGVYADRSPLTHIKELLKANLYVCHGRYDSSVPYTHTVNLARLMEKAGASSFFYDIFDGSHEILHAEAFKWFDYLCAGKKSAPVSDRIIYAPGKLFGRL